MRQDPDVLTSSEGRQPCWRRSKKISPSNLEAEVQDQPDPLNPERWRDRWGTFPTNPDTIADKCDGYSVRVLRLTASRRRLVVGADDGTEYVVDPADVNWLD